MQTSRQVIVLKNVEMEKDLNLNVMMATTKMETAVLLTVRFRKDGAVQEDQVLQPVFVC